jgi:hypothetical protein
VAAVWSQQWAYDQCVSRVKRALLPEADMTRVLQQLHELAATPDGTWARDGIPVWQLLQLSETQTEHVQLRAKAAAAVAAIMRPHTPAVAASAVAAAADAPAPTAEAVFGVQTSATDDNNKAAEAQQQQQSELHRRRRSRQTSTQQATPVGTAAPTAHTVRAVVSRQAASRAASQVRSAAATGTGRLARWEQHLQQKQLQQQPHRRQGQPAAPKSMRLSKTTAAAAGAGTPSDAAGPPASGTAGTAATAVTAPAAAAAAAAAAAKHKTVTGKQLTVGQLHRLLQAEQRTAVKGTAGRTLAARQLRQLKRLEAFQNSSMRGVKWPGDTSSMPVRELVLNNLEHVLCLYEHSWLPLDVRPGSSAAQAAGVVRAAGAVGAAATTGKRGTTRSKGDGTLGRRSARDSVYEVRLLLTNPAVAATLSEAEQQLVQKQAVATAIRRLLHQRASESRPQAVAGERV